jgi:hypothetical protein
MGLVPGTYQLRVTAQGFPAAEQRVVVADQPQTVAVALAAPPPVSVNGEPSPSQPSAVLLDTKTEGGATPAKAQILTITAGPGERGVFTPATLKDYPHQSVTIFDHHTKKNETYSGVPLMDLLAHLGVPHGKDLMERALAKYVVATGSDGYTSVVALAEIDPEFHPGTVLVADSLDGKPLPGKTGPFRLVVSEDKRPARSVWGLVSIDVRSVE